MACPRGWAGVPYLLRNWCQGLGAPRHEAGRPKYQAKAPTGTSDRECKGAGSCANGPEHL